MPRITEGICLQQLIEGGAEFEINPDDHQELDSDIEEEDKVKEAMLQFSNMDCLGSEENYDEEPFKVIAQQMTDVTPDGGVKKKIMRAGYGSTPQSLSHVRVDYNAYVEYEAEPFDSTYSRKKRQEFIVDNYEVILGLNEAVKSMLLAEKSQFLFSPEYAYGALGCLGRVPQNATVLFEIELVEIINSGSVISYEKLPEEEKNTFKEVYSYCLSLCERAKDKFKKNVKDSLKDYNLAASKLEMVQLSDYSEQEKQQELLLRVLSNVLICQTILNNPKKGCIAANKIYKIVDGTTIKISAKTYFSHAKCLRMLGQFGQAKSKLEKARILEPRNPEIANEFIALRNEELKYKKEEKKWGEKFVQSLSDKKD